ncbi:NAD(P)/FAD-dependent oxidoreductase [Fodinicurvata sp. EGI_FJ10296]|uniref:NAD(P)/FAD-dependent oxidoreductase n=1 Tax=Fodinicurvata sp. EGI_FJ10296 TaxID=3231908 RepID=UPI0034565D4B
MTETPPRLPPRPPEGLDGLEARLRQDLEWLTLPPPDWVRPTFDDRGERIADVVIVGAGMTGLAAAFALQCAGIRNIVLLDRAPEGQEGPWVTYARMQTLRSPKQLVGPALGIPSLTFRAWYEAQFGPEAWEALEKIPRPMWMDYLRWYRRALDLPVRNGVAVDGIERDQQGRIRLAVTDNGTATTILTRKLVMATGRDGLGGPYVPPFIQDLPSHLWAHSAHDIDFEALKSKKVAVIGIGASSVDNAASALEAGAGEVRIFVRRPDVPRINKLTGISSPGLVHSFPHLPESWRWRILSYADRSQVPPPRSSVLRVTRHPHAHIHLASPILSAEPVDGGRVRVTTPHRQWTADFIIAGTGFAIDLDRRPELSAQSGNIKLWRDVYVERGEEQSDLAGYPYLGPAFEFLEKDAGRTPELRDIHCFNYASTLTHGKVSGDIPAVSDGAARLARGIAAHFYRDDIDWHYEQLQAFDRPEVFGDEWTDAEAVTPA